MSMLPYSQAELAQEASDFSAKITPCRERWEYCLDRSSFRFKSGFGAAVGIDPRTIPVCERILGLHPGGAALRLRRLAQMGFEAAEEWATSRRLFGDKPFFAVGPMEAWHVGHVYFARLVSHPHVVKIGFSRRVRSRLEDIERKSGSMIFVNRGEMRVGTMADEHWWHRTWRPSRISGEWFFDPSMGDRSLPEFLQRKPVVEAA